MYKNAIKDNEKTTGGTQEKCEGSLNESYRFKGNELESDEEEGFSAARPYEEFSQRQDFASLPLRMNYNGVSRASEQLSQSVASSSDSVDGYDSFENTNNKKKRKIPTSGNPGAHHNSLSASLTNDLANMGISNGGLAGSADGGDGAIGNYYGSGSSVLSTISGTGVSGAGRGRFGRTSRRDASGRSPLAISMNGSNAWQMGRLLGPRRDQTTPNGTTGSKGKG